MTSNVTNREIREFFTRGKRIKLHDGDGMFLEFCKVSGLAKVIAPSNMIRAVPVDDLVRMNMTNRGRGDEV